MGKIVYKINILQALKEKGISSYKLRSGEIIGGATAQKIRRGEIVNAANLARLCRLLDCQPGDLLEYVPDDPAQDQPPANPAAQP